MRKGFLASVAALAAGAGVALGQGYPAGPMSGPQNFPGWGATGPGGPPPAGFMGAPPAGVPMPGGPMGMPPGAMPAGVPMGLPPGAMPAGGPAAGALPPATELPNYGPVPGPNCEHPVNPMMVPQGPAAPQQVHKAAGGPDHWYMDLEYLVWYPKSMPVPYPLLTASPTASAGIIGADGTRVLFPTENIKFDSPFNVFRLTGGFWGVKREWGFEASGFIQEAKGEYYTINAPLNARQVLARPVINAIDGLNSSLLVSVPTAFAGEGHVESRLKMGGAEASLLKSAVYCDTFKLNFLGGIRYIDHDENLNVVTRSYLPGLAPDDPSLLDVADYFATRNQFVGVNLGFQSEFRHGRCYLGLIGKVGLGNMNQQLDISGTTNTQVTGVTSQTPGGLFAVETNSGRFTKNEFAYVPELTVKLGYNFTQRISGFVGYNLLYLSSVMRPADQINPVVNPILVPTSLQFGGDFGPISPVNTFKTTDFFTQGFLFGLAINY